MAQPAVRSFSRILRSSPKRLSRQVWGAGHAIQDADTGQRLRVVHVEVTEVAAPAAVAEALGIPEGAAVLSRARKFAVEDRIVQTATSYIPLDVVAAAPAIAYTGPGPGGMYARMDEAGLGPKRFRELLDFRPPTTAERTELALTDSTWVIAITRQAYTKSDRCVEVNVMVLDATAYMLEYQFES